MTEAEIAELVRAFEAGTLPRDRWTHAAHLSTALWYLRRHPRAEAGRRIRDGIRAYNARQGNLTGYHETITTAWIEVIDRFLVARGRDRPASELAVELIEAVGVPGYLGRFYSDAVLKSPEARRDRIPPDRAGFDDDALGF